MLFVRILNSKLLLSLLVGNGCRTHAEFSFLGRKSVFSTQRPQINSNKDKNSNI